MPFGGGDGGNAADDGSGDDAGGGDGGGTLQCELAESHRITAVEKVDGRQRCVAPAVQRSPPPIARCTCRRH